MGHTTTLQKPRQVSSASKLIVWMLLYICVPKIKNRITEKCWKHIGYSDDKNLKCGYGMCCWCISQKLPTQEFYSCMCQAGPLGLKTSIQKGFPWLLGHHIAVESSRHLATLEASSYWMKFFKWPRMGKAKGGSMGDLSSYTLFWTHFVILKYLSISSLVKILS